MRRTSGGYQTIELLGVLTRQGVFGRPSACVCACCWYSSTDRAFMHDVVLPVAVPCMQACMPPEEQHRQCMRAVWCCSVSAGLLGIHNCRPQGVPATPGVHTSEALVTPWNTGQINITPLPCHLPTGAAQMRKCVIIISMRVRMRTSFNQAHLPPSARVCLFVCLSCCPPLPATVPGMNHSWLCVPSCCCWPAGCCRTPLHLLCGTRV